MIHFVFKKYEELSNDELYELLLLRNEVFIVEQNCPYQDLDGKDKYAVHVLGYEENILVAYTRVLPKGISYESYASIGRVVTKATARGKEYGKLLMETSISLCQKLYSESIKISAQAYLEKFYSDLGFKQVSELYLEDDIPHMAMVYLK